MSIKATYSRDLLLGSIQRVIGAVESKMGTLPTLTNCLIESTGRLLRFTGTNLEMQLVSTVEAEGPQFAICAGARKLHDILKGLPDDRDVTLSLADEKLTLTSGRGRYTFATIPAANFPAFDKSGESTVGYRLELDRLKWAIGRVQTTMANQDVRYYLNGLHLVFEGERAILQASDGSRLARQVIPLARPAAERREGIIPRRAVAELLRTLPELPDEEERRGPNVLLNDRNLAISWGATQFMTKLVAGRYPDTERVLPKTFQAEMDLDRAAMLAIMRRVVTVFDDPKKKPAVQFQFSDGTMRVSSATAEGEEGHEVVDVDWPGSLSIAFNGSYVIDILNHITTDIVRLGLNGDGLGSQFTHTGELEGWYVLMPMRV